MNNETEIIEKLEKDMKHIENELLRLGGLLGDNMRLLLKLKRKMEGKEKCST